MNIVVTPVTESAAADEPATDVAIPIPQEGGAGPAAPVVLSDSVSAISEQIVITAVPASAAAAEPASGAVTAAGAESPEQASAGSGAGSARGKRTYPAPAEKPTQPAPKGIL